MTKPIMDHLACHNKKPDNCRYRARCAEAVMLGVTCDLTEQNKWKGIWIMFPKSWPTLQHSCKTKSQYTSIHTLVPWSNTSIIFGFISGNNENFPKWIWFFFNSYTKLTKINTVKRSTHWLSVLSSSFFLFFLHCTLLVPEWCDLSHFVQTRALLVKLRLFSGETTPTRIRMSAF